MYVQIMTKIQFNNSYAKLPDIFYSKTNPTPVKNPELIQFNNVLAEELGLSEINSDQPEVVSYFSGNKIMEGSEPLSMAYAGHQFGGFSPQLGDGRAILLGETIGLDGVRYDMQLKGSGRTPWSRGGDGRSALGPVLREYLVSEAMAKLGVPTTRALAVVTSGEEVARDKLVPGGILTRISTGFVRVGTFQYLASKGDIEALKQLADYAIERHYPKVKDSENPYPDFLAAVVYRQAKLIAQWMSVGFIHGVMNTDNMSIVGETLDYGPCAFMDEFEHNRVYSSIDRDSRYAYNNQAKIGQWNLTRLAETLLPLFVEGESVTDEQGEAAVKIAQDILNNYVDIYKGYWLAEMQRKLGLSKQMDGDAVLINELLDIMQSNKADFTLVFYYLSQLGDPSQSEKIRALFTNPNEFNLWEIKWRERLAKESLNGTEHQAMMETVNPVYIPRNHQIEAAIRAAEDHNDFSLFHALNEVLQNPFKRQDGKDVYMLPPKLEEVVHQTFCGT